MSDALKDIRDALSSRTQHFVLPKQWAAMRKAEQIERDTGTKILHFEKGDFQGDEFYPAPAHLRGLCQGHSRWPRALRAGPGPSRAA